MSIKHTIMSMPLIQTDPTKQKSMKQMIFLFCQLKYNCRSGRSSREYFKFLAKISQLPRLT